MSANSSASQMNKLAKKEAELFKIVVNSYETKQYQKGLKNAELILKKHPNHGETQAMKGLITNCLGRRDEAYELVKLGLKNDLRSHVCWHVYGLLYRSDTNYKEAIKCYLNALRIDPNNQNILRDLSWLQIQMRDIAGFVASRYSILKGRPNLRISWIAYAAGNYLGEQYSVAYDVVQRYQENQSSNSSTEKGEKYEEGELILFQNLCLEKQGKFDEGLKHLDTHSKKIIDKYAYKIKIAEYLLKLGRFEEAKEKWLSLVLYQTDNYRLHCGLQCAYLELSLSECEHMLGLKHCEVPSTTLSSLTTAQRDILSSLYNTLEARVKKSHVLTKIKMTFLDGSEFEKVLTQYTQYCLREGIPSLCHDICSLIRGPDSLHWPSISSNGTSVGNAEATSNVNRVVVSDCYEFRSHPLAILARQIIERFITNLESSSSFKSSVSEAETEAKEDGHIEPPTALLWSYYLLAHLLEKSGLLQEAVVAIDKSIEHTPTALDMHLKKAKLLKKLLRMHEAAEIVNYGRSLDLQDRYLNNKATRYYLRADRVPDAMSTIAMFTKHEPGEDAQKALTTLQCNWYELELARAYGRLRQWGYALKKYHDILKHFKDYTEDMFDFHNYAFRKSTLRMYLDTIRMQNESYSHKFFQLAAADVLTIYLHFIDCPEDIDGLGHLNAKDRKKEREKMKKRRQKEQELLQKQQALAAATAAMTTSTTNADGESTAPDKPVEVDDVTGDKYVQPSKNFLTECDMWCNALMPSVSLLYPETIALLSEVYMRKGKYIQLTRCLVTGLKMYPLHPELNIQLIKFSKKIKNPDGISKMVVKESILEIIKEQIDILLHPGQKDLSSYVSSYGTLAKDLNSLPHILAYAEMTVLLASAKNVTAAKQSVASVLIDESLWSGRGVNATSVVKAYKFIKDELKSTAEAYRLACRSRYPLATEFQSEEEINATAAIATDADCTVGEGSVKVEQDS